jgi:hypothetical protein
MDTVARDPEHVELFAALALLGWPGTAIFERWLGIAYEHGRPDGRPRQPFVPYLVAHPFHCARCSPTSTMEKLACHRRPSVDGHRILLGAGPAHAPNGLRLWAVILNDPDLSDANVLAFEVAPRPTGRILAVLNPPPSPS